MALLIVLRVSVIVRSLAKKLCEPLFEVDSGHPYALFVRAGNDGSGAITSVRRILAGLSVREVQEPVLIAGNFDKSRLTECEELGMTMAAGLEADVF